MTPENPNSTDTGQTEAPKQKPRRRLITILAVVGVALVALAVGGWQWHKQPTFCSTACHSVMAEHVESWQTSDLMDNAHQQEGVTCLQCHEQSVGQEFSELTAFVTGDYETPLASTGIGTAEACFSCHGNDDPDDGEDWAAIVAATDGYYGAARNPHNNHLRVIACDVCHNSHDDTVVSCNETCHRFEAQKDAASPGTTSSL